jgi:hypothetical protein
MREQVQRLNKRPGVETQQGQLTSGVTQTPNMPFVQQQKTSGQRLAETIGMVVEGGTKIAKAGVELYQGQKKEEAANRIAEEQFTWMDEMNNLNSDADRVQYIQDKVKSVSSEDVDENYRNGVIGFFDSYYNTATKGAKLEQDVAVGNILSNEFYADMLSKGTIDYDGIVSRYTHLPKKYYHAAYQKALTAYVNQEFNPSKIKSLDDLEAAKARTDKVLSEYKNNKFTGGSRAVEAIELQTSLNKVYNTSLKNIKTEMGASHKLWVAQQKDNPTIIPELFNKQNTKAAELGLISELESYTANKEYTKKWEQQQTVEATLDVYYDDAKDIGNNWSTIDEKSKQTIIDKHYENLEFNTQAKVWTSLADNINDIPEIGKKFLNDRFDYAQAPEEIRAELTTYIGLRSISKGRAALTKLETNDRLMYEILTYNPKANIESIQDFINLKKEGGGKFNFGEDKNDNYKDWSKVIKKLPFKDRLVAEGLRDFHYARNQDSKAAIKYVEDTFAKDLTHTLGTPNVKGFKKINISGFETEEKSQYYLDAVGEVFGEYSEFDTIVRNPDGTIEVSDSSFPTTRATLTQKELDKMYVYKLMQKTDADTLDYQDFIEEIAVVKNNWIDYWNTWGEVAADGGWVQTASYAIPVGVAFKSVKDGYKLYKWMKDTGAVGDFVLDLSSKVVSRGNLQKASDLLQKAGYNVKIGNKGKSFTVTKKQPAYTNLNKTNKKGVQINATKNAGKKVLGVGGIGTALALALQGDAQAQEEMSLISNLTVSQIVEEVMQMPEEQQMTLIDNLTNEERTQELLQLTEEEQMTLVKQLTDNFGEVNEYGMMMSPEEEAEMDAYVNNNLSNSNTPPMDSMLDTEGVSNYIANGDANRIPQEISPTANSTVTAAFNSFSSLEGDNVHVDTANIFTMAGGVVPNRNSVKVKNPTTNQWELIDPKNKPSWLTNSNVKDLEIDYTNASYTIPGTRTTIKYNENPATFNERILEAYDNGLASVVDGYNNLDEAVKISLIQNAWNTGPEGVTWSGFRTALDYIQSNNLTENSLVAPTSKEKELLLKPAVKHNSSSGSILASLIYRRALVYNSVVSDDNKVTKIKVTKDKNNKLVFNFYNDFTLIHSEVNKTRINRYSNKLNKFYSY